MKKICLKSVAAYIALLPMFFLLSSCSDEDYLNTIPSNSIALTAVDMQRLDGKNIADKICKTLNIDNIENCGLDLKTKLYIFETQEGNIGLSAKVADEGDLEKCLNIMAKDGYCQNISKYRDEFIAVGLKIGYLRRQRGMTQEQLAEKMGVSQSSIANKLRLLNLAPEVQDALLQEKISERHARSLLALPKEEQAEWLKKIISKRLTVRQLDLEIKKAKGEVEEEIPLVNPNPDLKAMINNATDINKTEPIREVKNVEPTPVVSTNQNNEPIEQKNQPNKFFNFLEDEVANMQMTPSEPAQAPNESIEELEILDDFTSSINEQTPPQAPKEEDTIMPFLFDNKETQTNNTIEEIKDTQAEKIVDPMDAVIKLDPNYNQFVEEAKGIDLKTAINEIRDMISSMEKQGFKVSLDEIDLNDKYQMTINIQKNN